MDKLLRRLEEVSYAISRVYDALPPEKRRLIKMKYWEKRYNTTGIAEALHISEMTFYRWRRQFGNRSGNGF